MLAGAVGWAVLLVALEPASWPAVGAVGVPAGILLGVARRAVALRAGDRLPPRLTDPDRSTGRSRLTDPDRSTGRIHRCGE